VSGSLWGWRLPGLNTAAVPLDSVCDMAKAFRAEASRWSSSLLGQAVIGGISFGGLLAFQVMLDLRQENGVRAAVLISPPLLRRERTQYKYQIASHLWDTYREVLDLPEPEFQSLPLGDRAFLIATKIAESLDALSDDWIASRFLPPREALAHLWQPDAIGRRIAVQFSNLYASGVYAPDLSRKRSRTVAVVPYDDIPLWDEIQSSWAGLDWDAVYFVPGSHATVHNQSPAALAEIMSAEAAGTPETISPVWLAGPNWRL
jgi:thioesterase domain-containing protein